MAETGFKAHDGSQADKMYACLVQTLVLPDVDLFYTASNKPMLPRDDVRRWGLRGGRRADRRSSRDSTVCISDSFVGEYLSVILVTSEVSRGPVVFCVLGGTLANSRTKEG